MNGTEMIATERQRQIEKEGWTPEHDDTHDSDELALAAAMYAIPEGQRDYSGPYPDWPWPWPDDDFKPTPNNRVRELVKAGALIAAEIDRIQRMNGTAST